MRFPPSPRTAGAAGWLVVAALLLLAAAGAASRPDGWMLGIPGVAAVLVAGLATALVGQRAEPGDGGAAQDQQRDDREAEGPRAGRDSRALADERRRQARHQDCLLYTSPSPRDRQKSRMPSSA